MKIKKEEEGQKKKKEGKKKEKKKGKEQEEEQEKKKLHKSTGSVLTARQAAATVRLSRTRRRRWRPELSPAARSSPRRLLYGAVTVRFRPIALGPPGCWACSGRLAAPDNTAADLHQQHQVHAVLTSLRQGGGEVVAGVSGVGGGSESLLCRPVTLAKTAWCKSTRPL